MFSVGGTVSNKENKIFEDDGPRADVNGPRDKSVENPDEDVFRENGGFNSAEAQLRDDWTEMNAILAEGNFDDLSDEDLAKINNPALRAKLARMVQEKKSEQQSRADQEARRQAWDSRDHDFGGKTWKPQELRAFLNWSKDPKNLDKVDKELTAKGYSKDQVKTMRQKFEDARDLQDKEANGEKLTKEEQVRLDAYKKDKDVVTYTAEASSQQQVELASDVKYSLSKTSSSPNEYAAAKVDALAELDRRSGHTVGPQSAAHSLGNRLAQQDAVGTEQDEKQDSTVLAQARDPLSPDVALKEDFSAAAAQQRQEIAEPETTLSGKFKQANVAQFPLDQEQKPSTHPPVQLAMNGAAAGLSF